MDTSRQAGRRTNGVSPKEIAMKRALFNTCWMAMLMAGLALSVPVHAAKHMGMMDGQKGMGSPHMSGVMRDISKEMGKMRKKRDEMMKGSPAAPKKKY